MIITRNKWMELEGQIRERKLKIVKLRRVFLYPQPITEIMVCQR